MTREEAIERYDRIRYNLLNREDKAAVDVAFDALRELKKFIVVHVDEEQMCKSFCAKAQGNCDLCCLSGVADWLKQPYGGE